MSSEKTLAIVLRLVDFSETSVVTTLFTRDFGKIGALAKGARRPKGPFEAALDLLAVCRIVFIQKSSDALDLLTEARLERRFRASSHDLSRLYAGYYIAELLRELTDTGDPHPTLFDIANQTILDLDSGEEVAGTVLQFEMSALEVLGHRPSLEICVACGKTIEDSERVFFGQLAGGVLCPRCRPGQRQVISVSPGVIAALRQLSVADGNSSRPQLSPEVRGEARAVLNRYLESLLDRRLKMHQYARWFG